MTGSGDESQSLIKRAVRLLARHARSREELRTRLQRWGRDEEIAAVLQRLEELHLLSDEEYAYNFALRRMRQEGWGQLKVLQALLRKKISASAAEEAIRRVQVEMDPHAQVMACVEQYCHKKGWPHDRNSLLRIIQHLRRKGFPDERIFPALRQRCAPNVWRAEDSGE